MDRIVAARRKLMSDTARLGSGEFEFYDPRSLCVSAPVRDNLLFGRITYGVGRRRTEGVRRGAPSIKTLELEPQIYRLGLDFQTGNGGRRLSPAQRSAVSHRAHRGQAAGHPGLENALVAFGESERGRSPP